MNDIPSRRTFLHASAAAVAAATASSSSRADETKTLRIGLIGCGSRGTGAAEQALCADANVKLVAMGDAFDDRLKQSLAFLQKEKKVAALVNARKLSAAELKERAGFHLDRPMSLSNTLRQLVSAATIPMPKFSEKTHLIVVRSLGDKLCRPECSERLARHYRATLQTHPTAGHDLPVDEPQWLVDRLKENL